MTPEQFQRVQEFFTQASRLLVEERDAFLDENCHDVDIRREVESLLTIDDDPSITDSGVAGFNVALLANAGAPHSLPERLGPYRILGILGEGGMGVVYRAEQESPKREIALKVVRGGLASTKLLRRFESEAEILGRLRHPGIAQIIESGTAQTTAGPQPFFAMELLHGPPLNKYIADHHPNTHRRLDIFCDICDAVQHAHQQGVVHRDLKPPNIMIESHADGSIQPKILDFGVARLIAADAQAATLHTEAGQLLGTLTYMSPEQLNADPLAIDTRTDVYALGVMLYELLTGQLPHSVAGTSVQAAIRCVQAQDPVPLTRHDASLRGDLDTIVRKAMDKDPSRRYESASELAADIRRHLSDQPISARPPTARYQLAKFARRNKELVSAVVMVLVLLVAGVIVLANRAATEAGLRRAADHNAYIASLAAAKSAIKDADPIVARRHLRDAPAHLRGWEWRHLAAWLNLSASTLSHASPVLDAAISPDGAVIAGGCEDGTVVLWNALDAARTQTIEAHGAAVRSVAFSPDGSGLLTAGDDATLKLWEIRSATTTTVKRFDNAVLDARFLPGGSHIAVLVQNGNHSVFHFLDGSSLAALPAPFTPPDGITNAAAFSPDSTLIAHTGSQYEVIISDAATGQAVRRFRNLPWLATALAWSQQSDRVYAAVRTKDISAWDLTTGDRLYTTARHANQISSLAVSRDGRLLASGARDLSVRIWDAADGSPVQTLLGHDDEITAVGFVPDSDRLISASLDHTIRIWDLGRNNVLQGHESYIYDATFSPDSKLIATASWDDTLRIWDASTERPLQTLTQPDHVLCAEFSPDGRFLAAGLSGSQGVVIYDARTWEQVVVLPSDACHAVVFSPDGSVLAHLSHALDSTPTIKFVDSQSWTTLLELPAPCHLSWHGDLAFLGEDQLVMTGYSPTSFIIDSTTGQVTARLEGAKAELRRLAISPDATRIALASDDGRTYIYDAATHQLVHTLVGHTAEVFSVAFTPDGSRLATGSNDATISIWDTKTGEQIIRLRGHDNYVHSLTFSPDGSALLSGSGDGTARIWRALPPASP